MSQADPSALSSSSVLRAAAPTTTDPIWLIAGRLADPSYGTGPLASLRRLDPAGALSEPALHRLLARYVMEDAPDPLRAWALLIHCMALAAPDGHRSRDALGAALFAAGFSEGRFARLMEARGTDVLVVAPRLIRFLVSRGQSVNPWALWALLQPTLLDRVGDTDRAERARTRIASDYYRAEAKAERATDPLTKRSE